MMSRVRAGEGLENFGSSRFDTQDPPLLFVCLHSLIRMRTVRRWSRCSSRVRVYAGAFPKPRFIECPFLFLSFAPTPSSALLSKEPLTVAYSRAQVPPQSRSRPGHPGAQLVPMSSSQSQNFSFQTFFEVRHHPFRSTKLGWVTRREDRGRVIFE